jgi:thymidine phosphorylase
MRPVPCPRAGFVRAIEAEALGHAVVHLGGGRLVGSDRINPSVGLSGLATIGEDMTVGEPLAIVHAATDAAADAAVAAVISAFTLSEAAPEEPPLIHERVA